MKFLFTTVNVVVLLLGFCRADSASPREPVGRNLHGDVPHTLATSGLQNNLRVTDVRLRGFPSRRNNAGASSTFEGNLKGFPAGGSTGIGGSPVGGLGGFPRRGQVSIGGLEESLNGNQVDTVSSSFLGRAGILNRRQGRLGGVLASHDPSGFFRGSINSFDGNRVSSFDNSLAVDGGLPGTSAVTFGGRGAFVSVPVSYVNGVDGSFGVPGVGSGVGGSFGVPGVGGGVDGSFGVPGVGSGVGGSFGVPGVGSGIGGSFGVPGVGDGIDGSFGVPGGSAAGVHGSFGVSGFGSGVDGSFGVPGGSAAGVHGSFGVPGVGDGIGGSFGVPGVGGGVDGSFGVPGFGTGVGGSFGVPGGSAAGIHGSFGVPGVGGGVDGSFGVPGLVMALAPSVFLEALLLAFMTPSVFLEALLLAFMAPSVFLALVVELTAPSVFLGLVMALAAPSVFLEALLLVFMTPSVFLEALLLAFMTPSVFLGLVVELTALSMALITTSLVASISVLLMVVLGITAAIVVFTGIIPPGMNTVTNSPFWRT
ncbi:glycine-rich cell wall structural protein-like [Homarus americanus]|uniref:Uncharacterized protein n=1 Tax=Homarus americanus TaxID=6706 RepID=A0A8J5N1U7_HOMAM|nr:glycine-rich cell wall structural protein-like [Homarus americanus]KAG7171682.1 hypothetical protein Hamer_G023097 [Homarus americanus]